MKAFSNCDNLKINSLVFPEGFERFDGYAFVNCFSLTGQIVLPSTIKEIGIGAFYRTKISSINLPEGLESIGQYAFYASCLKEIWIPNTCQVIGASSFEMNYPLKKIHLPEGLDTIPNNLANYCLELEEINIPSTVKTIGHGAFEACKSLKKINFPNGLEAIEYNAFKNCDSLEEITFPSSIKTIRWGSFYGASNLKRIYSVASEPPVCVKSVQSPGLTPFGKYAYPYTPTDIPVYVPIGSAEKYRNAWGWDYFTNFIETDDFPTAIHNTTIVPLDTKSDIYDLNGRRVINPQKGQVYIKNGKKVIFDR